VDASVLQAPLQAGPRRLAAFIRGHAEEILREWERMVRQLPVARDIDRLVLRDHIPDLLERIAEMSDDLVQGHKPRFPTDLAELHAIERLEEGFDLGQVIAEFSSLRDCILRLWSERSALGRDDTPGIRALNLAIDGAVSASVQRYTYVRDRTLQSLDRISAAALEARTVDEFLQRLLRVLLETTAAVDTAAILLREGELLRVRASVGMEDEVASRFALRIGEGFAGQIAATRQPRQLSSAATDPQVHSKSLRERGVKGLFGVPLVEGDELIGVAHMGSVTAQEFSIQDRQLFAAMANRATAAISQHMLRDAAERRAREQQAVAELGTRALAAADLPALLDDAARTVTASLDVEMAAALSLQPDSTLLVEGQSGWPQEIARRVRVPASDRSLAGYALEVRGPVIVDDLDADGRFEFPPGFREEHVRSVIGVPIPLPGTGTRIYGILTAQSRRARAFTSDHVAFLQACAHVVGTAIELHTAAVERAQLLAQEQAARLESEHTLALLDSVVGTAEVGIAFIDTELRYARINHALAALYGRTVEEHVGRTVGEVLGPHAAAILDPVLANMIATRRPVKNIELSIGSEWTGGRDRSLLASFVPVQTSDGTLLGIGAVVVDNTDRKRMEVELRERELQLQTLADNMPQLAWMADPSGEITWVNQRWYDYTGVDARDVAAHLDTIQHPEHIERVLARYAEHIETGEPWEDTFPMRGKDGQYRWFLSRAVPIRDRRGAVARWFGTNTDVTEQRFMAEATTVLSSSLDYRTTLELLATLAVPAFGDWCVIDLVEHGSTITRVALTHADPAKSDLAQRIRAYAPGWTARHGIGEVIRTGKPVLATSISPELLAERSRDAGHLELVRSVGLQSCMIVPLVARDRILGALTLVSAESGRHYTQHDLDLAVELGRRAGLAVDNARLYEESQRETRIREDVLAVVSHDLKNPLGAIHLAATLLLETSDARYRRHHETIYRAATRMDHLIGDLLDMASIRAGRFALERKPEEADALVREVLDLHEPIAIEKGLRLIRRCELPGKRLLCDRDRVLQVFGNLLGNALKFCGSGDQITLRGDDRGSAAEFAVEDTGPGIAAEELPHIFEPYWSAKHHAKKGTGLGLFITKGIVEAHQGTIRVESAPGLGTTFYFTLPFV
jgi:PAS domain S-box-containing protein